MSQRNEMQTTAAIQTQMAIEQKAVELLVSGGIYYSAITHIESLSEGNTSVTDLVSYNNKKAAMKTYDNNYPHHRFSQEWNAILETFPSEYVAEPVGYCLEPLSILTKYAENGALDLFLASHTLTFKQTLQMMNDTALGLLRLLDTNRVHGDVSTANILVTDELRAKICGFGKSRHKNLKLEEVVQPTSSAFNMAPEYYFYSPYKLKNLAATDVFSFGTTLIDLFVDHEMPGFKEYEELYEDNKRIHSQHEPQTKVGLLHCMLNFDLPNVPKRFQTAIKNIIRSCIDINPENRPTMEMVRAKLQHTMDLLLKDELAKSAADQPIAMLPTEEEVRKSFKLT